MLGAIIGDLAVSQWYIDKDRFYLELVTEESGLSDCGIAALEIAGYLCGGGDLNKDFASKYSFSYPVRDWEVYRSLITVVSGCLASLYDDEEEVRVLNQRYLAMIDCEKQDLYATNIVWSAILALRKGATKKMASDPHVNSFMNPLSVWDTHQEGILADVVRAWRCFYYAYDFSSTIHNAVKCIRPHITAVIAGMFAEAMYGCEYGMVKRKYGEHHFHKVTLPKSVQDGYKSQLSKIMKSDKSKLLFCKKNMTTSNVEKHVWKDYELPFFAISSKDCVKIRLHKVPDILYRSYDIYLDDGWYYCCSRNVILLRFQLEENAQGDSVPIAKLQLSEEMGASVSLMGLLYALRDTCKLKGFDYIESFVRTLSFCLYYHGEKEEPKALSDDEKCFWGMEKHYYIYCCSDSSARLHWEYDAMSIWDDENILPYINCDKIPIEVKGMLSFTIQDFLCHAPEGVDVVYRYARKVGEFYHMEKR